MALHASSKRVYASTVTGKPSKGAPEMGDVERWCFERLRERLRQRDDGASNPRGSVSERLLSTAFRATVALGPVVQYGMRLLLTLVVCAGVGVAVSDVRASPPSNRIVHGAASTLRGD